jgi:hypothetical protein
MKERLLFISTITVTVISGILLIVGILANIIVLTEIAGAMILINNIIHLIKGRGMVSKPRKGKNIFKEVSK